MIEGRGWSLLFWLIKQGGLNFFLNIHYRSNLFACKKKIINKTDDGSDDYDDEEEGDIVLAEIGICSTESEDELVSFTARSGRNTKKI